MANSQPLETSKISRRNSPTISRSCSPPRTALFPPTPPTSKHKFHQHSSSPPQSTNKEETLEANLYSRCPQYGSTIQHGGYLLTLFIDNVSDDLKCGICGSIARDSVQTLHCGALFCKVCIDIAFNFTRNNSSNNNNTTINKPLRKPSYIVPNTKQEGAYCTETKIDCPNTNCTQMLSINGYFKDTRQQNQISKLRVMCPMKVKQCKWEGVLDDLISTHWFACELVKVPCPLGCGVHELRGQIEYHQTERCGKRLVACEYCTLQIENRLLNEHHSHDCIEYPIPCPNGCMNGEQRQSITRSQLAEHIANICPMVQLSCPYSDQGCADKLPRQELHNHLGNAVSMHLDLVRHHFITELNVCQNICLEQQILVNVMRHELIETTDCSKDQLLQLKAQHEEKISAFELKLTNISNLVNHLQDVITPVEQLNTTIAKLTEQKDELETKIAAYHRQHEEISRIAEENKRFKSTINKRVSQLEELNACGCYTWVIKSVSEKLKSKQFLYSDPFYTSPSGYRVCVSLAMDGFGTGEGTHMGLGLFLMKGRNDPFLNWPFDGNRKYILINHVPEGKHHVWQNSDSSDKAFQRPINEMGETGHGCPQFITHENLLQNTEQTLYVKDDTIIIRIIVKPSDINPI